MNESRPRHDRLRPQVPASARLLSSVVLQTLWLGRCRGMTLRSAVEKEIRDLIEKRGRITFAEFMQACLYSRRGGFYAARARGINAHFGTAPTTHPAFGALIARQLDEMWHLLEKPPVFHVIEVGSGDGALAQSIVHACERLAPGLARALCYFAADYEPGWPRSSDRTADWDNGTGAWISDTRPDAPAGVQRVKGEGVRAFRNVVGCILSNELIDNFPVHRFAIQSGRLREIFVTSAKGNLTEVLDEPSSARIEERLAGLGLRLPEGYRGEVNLGLEDWTRDVSSALERGFVLTIDYGHQAAELYAPENSQGTLVCFHRHAARNDPYQDIGQQDITSRVDFTTLMRLGERHGLATAGYVRQREFLTNLGLSSFLDALDTQHLSAARKELHRMAMTALVDPEQYGDFKVLAQAKGIGPDTELRGFASQGT